jgi:type IV pilus assembly protein PilB
MKNFSSIENVKDIFLAQGVIDQTVAESLANQSFDTADALFDFLLKESGLSEEVLYQKIASIIGFPYFDLRGKKIATKILEIIPFSVAQNYKLLSFDNIGGEVCLGLVDPYNFRAIEAIEFLVKQKKIKVKYYLISSAGYQEGLKQYSTFTKEVNRALAEVESAKKESQIEEGKKQGQQEVELGKVISQAPVSKIVSEIIKQGVASRASDIHIEPITNGSRVRYRIDGVLKTSLVMPAYIHTSIIARVKVLANLRLDETRIPQDGRITLNIEARQIDFRVSTMPLLDKEKVVLRILQGSDAVPTLEELGFHDHYIQLMKENIVKPHGLFLISGPTGSGKSTTLYTLLNMLNKDQVNITTLEDPIEFNLPGVNQSQIRPEVKFTFASGLRALLRQDPNIIMVGEIRDGQTAEMAIHAGLTGHLIFSTIHTNDALGVVPRLIDMQVEPFLLASTLNVIIAQRLTRKICSNCKIPADIPDYLIKKIRNELNNIDSSFFPTGTNLDKLVFYQGKGCDLCGGTGYQGRVAIAEGVQVTNNFQRLIVSGYNIDEVKAELKRQRLLTLFQDGLLRALEGLTTIDEVLRVIQE